MDRIGYERNKNAPEFQYNFQHVVLVSKYKFKVFKNPKTQKIVADAFKEVEMQHIQHRKFSRKCQITQNDIQKEVFGEVSTATAV